MREIASVCICDADADLIATDHPLLLFIPAKTSIMIQLND